MTDPCSMCALADGDDRTLLSLRRPEVFGSEHWRCVLNGPDQRYPGRCIVVARRHVPTVPELDSDQWSELRDVMGRLERAAQSALGATLSNWGCLMNHAFQVEAARPHVHWHFRPRYKTPIEFEGLRFEDEAFGRHYLREYRPLDEETLLALRDRLRSAVSDQTG